MSLEDATRHQKYFFSMQNEDGSWSVAPEYPGNLSVSIEAYLALRLTGISADRPDLQSAIDWILNARGVAKVGFLTSVWLASFGLFPWNAVPQPPPELVFLPAKLQISIHTLPYAARVIFAPMSIARHHQPIHPLPSGTNPKNSFLDELWVDEPQTIVLQGQSLRDSWEHDRMAFAVRAFDQLVGALVGFRWSPTRYVARKKCVQWMLQRQATGGSWGGFQTCTI